MKNQLISIGLLLLLLSSCAPQGPQTLTVLTHDSFSVSENLIRQFESENNVKVSFVKGGDAGSVLNKAILTKDAPLADVLYGVDNTFLSRALDAGIYSPYESPALAGIPDEYKLDDQNRALPVDYGDVCINYDKSYFAANNLALPQSLSGLIKPEYKGLLVVEDPATSSPGLAFLLATVATFGDGYLDYWHQLKDNDVVVVDSWETAYFTNFSASSGHGPQPMVVSYGSSPTAEVVYADPPVSESPTASLVGDGMCFRQVEFAGILEGTKNRAIAEKFIDFLLGKSFQEDMPLQMFVSPVNPKAAVPDVFIQNSQIPSNPATLDPQVIAINREVWIQGWNSVMNP
jgi:thiamine transport system substrate-binding protein